MIVGIDEVGYGAWAGPLYSVAFCFCNVKNSKEIEINYLDQIVDSKIIPVKKREFLAGYLKENFLYGTASIDNKEIDDINIRNADFKAMKLAYYNLLEKLKLLSFDVTVEKIFIDGNANPAFSDKIEVVIDGDAKIKEISAASIIAKVERDNFMKHIHEEFPYYGWDSNVGYGTAKHRSGIQEHRITKYHRCSYKPIKEYLKNK